MAIRKLFGSLIAGLILATGPLLAWGADAPLVTHVWTAHRCPSQPALAGAEALGTDIGTALIGTAVGAVFDMVSTALAAAAEADLKGRGIAGSDARYLYTVRLGKDQKTPAAEPATCLLVAVAAASNDEPVAWCNQRAADRATGPVPSRWGRKTEPDSVAAIDLACKNGATVLATVNSNSIEPPQTPTKSKALLPAFYAELALENSTDLKAVRPRLVNLYYPQPLQSRRGVTRDVTISVQMHLPDQDKGSSVVVVLKQIIPGSKGVDPQSGRYAEESLRSQSYLWTGMPVYDKSAMVTATNNKLRVGPINLVSEVRETGDINQFLQAFAKSFEKTKADYATAFKAQIFPETGQIADANAAAGLQGLVADAEKALAGLVSSCYKAIGGPTGYLSREAALADIAQQQAAVKAARMKANAKGLELDPHQTPYADLNGSCPAESPGSKNWL